MSLGLSAPDPSQFAILVVDDAATVVKLVRQLLWGGGYIHSYGASDGDGALSALRQARFDLVISTSTCRRWAA
jgi:CheY-like chemotaxis protein